MKLSSRTFPRMSLVVLPLLLGAALLSEALGEEWSTETIDLPEEIRLGTEVRPALGDFNGDGLLDWAARAGSVSGSLVLGLRLPDGGWDIQEEPLDIWQPYAVDVDGDGDDELLLFGANVRLLRNWVSPGVWNSWELQAESPLSVLRGDVDNDGDEEVLLLGGSLTHVTTLLEFDGQEFQESLFPLQGLDGRDVRLVDWEGDGDLDLVQIAPTVQLHLWNGAGWDTQEEALGIFENGAEVLDWDQDGDKDFLFRDLYVEGRWSILEQGDGQWWWKSFNLPEKYALGTLAKVDLNGDSQPEYLVAGGSGNKDSVLFWQEGRLQSLKLSISGQDWVAASDGNGDGRDEIWHSFSFSLGSYFKIDSLVGELPTPIPTSVPSPTPKSVGTPTPIPPGAGSWVSRQIPVGAVPRALAVADLNDDGQIELLSANHRYYPGFSNYTALEWREVDLHRRDLADGGYKLQGVAVGDFDGDGRADLVGVYDTSSTGNSLVLHLRQEDGSWLWNKLPGLFLYGRWLFAEDLNGNSRAEIVAVTGGSNSSVHWLEWDGEVWVREETPLDFDGSTPGTSVTGALLVNVDADPQKELLLSHSGEARLLVLERNATGWQQEEILTTEPIDYLAAGDFSWFANPVLFAAKANRVSIFTRNDGQWSEDLLELESSLNHILGSLGVADTDGDGENELLASTPEGLRVYEFSLESGWQLLRTGPLLGNLLVSVDYNRSGREALFFAGNPSDSFVGLLEWVPLVSPTPTPTNTQTPNPTNSPTPSPQATESPTVLATVAPSSTGTALSSASKTPTPLMNTQIPASTPVFFWLLVIFLGGIALMHRLLVE